jgi:hypothetical protein
MLLPNVTNPSSSILRHNPEDDEGPCYVMFSVVLEVSVPLLFRLLSSGM